MHELAVCQGMLRQVMDITRREQARTVTRILVQVGPLSGVEPRLLSQAFPIASAGTPAAGAVLELESLPVRVRCEQCGAETDARPNRLLCGACGDYHTRLLSGDELLLVSVELER
ncbi:MAG: hydrogenase maturation nickel metallochaperone HypA [Gammaproteobacteria bacterium]|nr:hydrogenase maturation nickel metallochaperone HypA [Gammaproteobacteria bacterium]